MRAGGRSTPISTIWSRSFVPPHIPLLLPQRARALPIIPDPSATVLTWGPMYLSQALAPSSGEMTPEDPGPWKSGSFIPITYLYFPGVNFLKAANRSESLSTTPPESEVRPKPQSIETSSIPESSLDSGDGVLVAGERREMGSVSMQVLQRE